MESLYKKGLVQLHDTGLASRMQELSGDPSALMPSSLDVASPLTPVADLTRYQERSVILHGPSFGGTSSGVYQFNCDMDVINAARAVQVEAIGWNEAYSGVSHNTWVELIGVFAMQGTVINTPLAAYLATLTGPSRDVQIVVQDEKISKARIDKPLTYSQSTAQAFDDSFRINALTFRWDRVSGSGILNVEDMMVFLKLYY